MHSLHATNLQNLRLQVQKNKCNTNVHGDLSIDYSGEQRLRQLLQVFDGFWFGHQLDNVNVTSARMTIW